MGCVDLQFPKLHFFVHNTAALSHTQPDSLLSLVAHLTCSYIFSATFNLLPTVPLLATHIIIYQTPFDPSTIDASDLSTCVKGGHNAGPTVRQ